MIGQGRCGVGHVGLGGLDAVVGDAHGEVGGVGDGAGQLAAGPGSDQVPDQVLAQVGLVQGELPPLVGFGGGQQHPVGVEQFAVQQGQVGGVEQQVVVLQVVEAAPAAAGGVGDQVQHLRCGQLGQVGAGGCGVDIAG